MIAIKFLPIQEGWLTYKTCLDRYNAYYNPFFSINIQMWSRVTKYAPEGSLTVHTPES